uniref:Uncharacterized protein n=1 Tax=Gadus morhua TaxID=8049 RepID=A0A8C5C8D8_GADMO
KHLLSCSEPSSSALLVALSPVFDLQPIRPVNDMVNFTEVLVSFTLYGILGVVSNRPNAFNSLWFLQGWKNEFISWDPEQCGTDQISLPRSKFWIPDIVINEFMAKNTAPAVPFVHVHSDGWIYDFSPVRVVSSCNLNIYTFPFDVQNCTFTFGSYMVELNIPIKEILKNSMEVMTTVGEWQLIDIIAYKESHDAEPPYGSDELVFHIGLRRKSTLYVVNLIIPSCFLITVDLFSFLLPPQSVDRSAFKMTLILGYTVFLLLMNDLLPVTGNTIPLINVFFSLCLALMVASLLETILITNLHSSSSRLAPVPRWVRVVFLQTLGCCVGLPSKPPKEHSTGMVLCTHLNVKDLHYHTDPNDAVEEGGVDRQQRGNHNSEEWIQVAGVIDRFLFWLYAVFIIVSFVVMICIWASSYSK